MLFCAFIAGIDEITVVFAINYRYNANSIRDMTKLPNANIIYINKEDIDFVDITSYKKSHDYISMRLVGDKTNYIFIDEVQEIDE